MLAVPDGSVRETAEKFALLNPSRRVGLVHLSGALGLDALASLEDNPVGSFHPLQSFPTPRGPSAFHGITVAVDASSPALRRRLGRIAKGLGAHPKHVTDEERAIYHAAAVFASNFVDVAFAEGVRMLTRVGWSRREGIAALLPLLDGAVANIHKLGPVQALTGPIRRGDANTVRRHLEAVDNPELYRMLALVALEIAREAGLDPAAAGRTRRALTRNVAATRRRRGR